MFSNKLNKKFIGYLLGARHCKYNYIQDEDLPALTSLQTIRETEPFFKGVKQFA